VPIESLISLSQVRHLGVKALVKTNSFVIILAYNTVFARNCVHGLDKFEQELIRWDSRPRTQSRIGQAIESELVAISKTCKLAILISCRGLVWVCLNLVILHTWKFNFVD
jgi:hypothetical protein